MTPADWQKSNEPRRVQRGLKLARNLENRFDEEPVASLIQNIQSRASEKIIESGWSWARMGQVREIELETGYLKGLVQGIRAQPHEVVIDLGVITASCWERIIERVSGEAGCIVELQEGKIPNRLLDICEQEGEPLIPCSVDVKFKVDGVIQEPDTSVYCFALIAFSRLINDPLRLFSLRGVPIEELLGRIQRVRALTAGGQAFAHQSPSDPGDNELPLEKVCDSFWEGKDVEPIDYIVESGFPKLALLRRMGRSPMLGKFPMSGLLETIYVDVASHVKKDEESY